MLGCLVSRLGVDGGQAEWSQVAGKLTVWLIFWLIEAGGLTAGWSTVLPVRLRLADWSSPVSWSSLAGRLAV